MKVLFPCFSQIQSQPEGQCPHRLPVDSKRISVSVTAVMLSLTIRLYRRYHTLDFDRITLLMKGEDD